MILSDYTLIGGDAIFTYSNSWLSRKIFWFSKWRESGKKHAKISHVAMFLRYENGVPIIAEANQHVQILSGKKYNNKKYEIHVARPMIRMSADKILKLTEYMEQKKGEDYAYTQIAAHALKKIFNINRVGDWDRDAVICSEIYAEAYADCFGFKVVPGKLPYDVNPLEIYESENMQQVAPKE